jgi:hypothetical protein
MVTSQCEVSITDDFKTLFPAGAYAEPGLKESDVVLERRSTTFSITS